MIALLVILSIIITFKDALLRSVGKNDVGFLGKALTRIEIVFSYIFSEIMPKIKFHYKSPKRNIRPANSPKSIKNNVKVLKISFQGFSTYLWEHG